MSDVWKDGTKVRFRPSFTEYRTGYDGVFTTSDFNPNFRNVLVQGIGRVHLSHLIVVERPTSETSIKRSDVQEYLDLNESLPLDKVVDVLRYFDVEVEEDEFDFEVGKEIGWSNRYVIPRLPVNAVLRSSESIVYDRWLGGWYSAGPKAEHFPRDTDFEEIEGEFPFVILYLPEEL